MPTRSPKQVLFEQFAAVAKTLGHAHRLELIEQLAQGERSVEVLAARSGLSIANTSQHLQHLRRAGLVTVRAAARVASVGSGLHEPDRTAAPTIPRAE